MMKQFTLCVLGLLLACLLPLRAEVPPYFSYQGEVSVGGQPFAGMGQFRFSLRNAAGDVLWNHDGTTTGDPLTSMPLSVTKGVFSVRLGDASLPGMSPLPPAVVQAVTSASEVFVHIWFNDGTHGLHPLTPAKRLSAVTSALMADQAEGVNQPQTAAKLAPSSVTSAKLAAEAVTSAALVNNAVTATKLDSNAVTAAALAPNAVRSSHLATGAVVQAATRDGVGLLPIGSALIAHETEASALTESGFTAVGDPVSMVDEWNVAATGPNTNYGSSVIWAGTEMILFSGPPAVPQPVTAYDPATQKWRALPLTGITGPVPLIPEMARPIFTGSQVLSWHDQKETAPLRYDVPSEKWLPMSAVGAPAMDMSGACEVWTGSEWIIWGGRLEGTSTDVATGARYNPTTDTWTPMSTVGAPTARYEATEVWMGTELFVWGGRTGSPTTVRQNTGGRYNPLTDTWTPLPTTGAPAARTGVAAVWTGTQVLLFGDQYADDVGVGFSYTPSTDTWAALPTLNQPSQRSSSAIVWTGTEMIVWGGHELGVQLYDGARYNPNTGIWTPIAATLPNTPDWPIYDHVWTGSQLLLWGGSNSFTDPVNKGAAYNPVTNTWTPIPVPVTPYQNAAPQGGWTGTEFIVWGQSEDAENPGVRGHRFNPGTETWTALTTAGAPSTSYTERAFGLNSGSLFLYGGSNGGSNTSGGYRYDLASDTWYVIAAPTINGVAHAVKKAACVWTGTEFIVWGGSSTAIPEAPTNTGARWNATTGLWTVMSTVGAPVLRQFPPNTAWTGTELLVWGTNLSATAPEGARYNPTTNTWTPLATASGPTAVPIRSHWTGSEWLIISESTTGSPTAVHRYNPTTNTWTAATSIGAPTSTTLPQTAWTDTELMVWSGRTGTSPDYQHQNTIAWYNPSTNTWRSGSPAPLLFPPRTGALSVWSGSEVLIFGGTSIFETEFPGRTYNDLARLSPQATASYLYVKTGTQGGL